MQIKIGTYEFERARYGSFQVWVNGEKKTYKKTEDMIVIDTTEEQDELHVKVEFINKAFDKKEGNSRLIGFCVRTIIRILDSYSETQSTGLGKPYHAVLEFTCTKNQTVSFYSNSVWNDHPFTLEHGRINVIRNEFYSDQSAKKKWMITVGIPRILVVGALFTGTFLGVLHNEFTVILEMAALGFFGWLIGVIVYAVKLVKRH